MMPVSGAAVQALGPHQVARGSTLINVNRQVAGSIGRALMSVILTNQFNRSETIEAGSRALMIQEEAARRGVPPDPSLLPPRVLQPDIQQLLLHDLSHAYTGVFVAVGLVVATIIPAAFLPKKPAPVAPGLEPLPAMAH